MVSKPTPENIRLRVIPKPKGNSIAVIITKNRPAFRGKNGGFNYLCGFCDTILAVNIKKDEVREKVVQCYDCLRFNEFS
jgi:hypothetical protein